MGVDSDHGEGEAREVPGRISPGSWRAVLLKLLLASDSELAPSCRRVGGDENRRACDPESRVPTPYHRFPLADLTACLNCFATVAQG